MERLRLPYYILVGLLAVSCSSAVQTERDNAVDISPYKTYRWITQNDSRYLHLERPPIEYLAGVTSMRRSPEAERKLGEWIDGDLRKKGYLQTQSERPDFFVTFYYRDNSNHWRSTWEGVTPSLHDTPVVMYPGFTDSNEVKSYRPETLLITFYDARTHRPVWLGKIYNAFDASGTLNATALIASIQKALDDFPAKA